MKKSGPRTRVRHRWSALFAPPPSSLTDISLHLQCSACKCESNSLLLKERICYGIVTSVHAFSVFYQECVVFCTLPILSLYTVVHPLVLIDPSVGNLSVVAHLPSCASTSHTDCLQGGHTLRDSLLSLSTLMCSPIFGLLMMTTSDRESHYTNGGHNSPVRAGPAHESRMPSLPRPSMATSLFDPRRSWASQKWPATKQRRPALLHVRLEMAVGTLVACESASQILTCLCSPSCHSHADAFVLAANSPAFGTASVSGVLGETARAPASTIETRRWDSLPRVGSTPKRPDPLDRDFVSDHSRSSGRRS